MTGPVTREDVEFAANYPFRHLLSKDEDPPAPKPFWLRAVSWFKKETMQ